MCSAPQREAGSAAAADEKRRSDSRRRPSGAQTQFQGAHHHVPGARERRSHFQEENDREQQIQEPAAERNRRVKLLRESSELSIYRLREYFHALVLFPEVCCHEGINPFYLTDEFGLSLLTLKPFLQ